MKISRDLPDSARIRIMAFAAGLTPPTAFLFVILSLLFRTTAHPERSLATLLEDGPGNLMAVFVLNAIFVPLTLGTASARVALILAALYGLGLAGAWGGYALVVRLLHGPIDSVIVLARTILTVGPLCALVIAGPLRIGVQRKEAQRKGAP